MTTSSPLSRYDRFLPANRFISYSSPREILSTPMAPVLTMVRKLRPLAAPLFTVPLHGQKVFLTETVASAFAWNVEAQRVTSSHKLATGLNSVL